VAHSRNVSIVMDGKLTSGTDAKGAGMQERDRLGETIFQHAYQTVLSIPRTACVPKLAAASFGTLALVHIPGLLASCN
jgi:hypothetical protein